MRPKDFHIQLSVVVLDVGVKFREHFLVVARVQVVDASHTMFPENEANNLASFWYDVFDFLSRVLEADNPVCLCHFLSPLPVFFSREEDFFQRNFTG